MPQMDSVMYMSEIQCNNWFTHSDLGNSWSYDSKLSPPERKHKFIAVRCKYKIVEHQVLARK